MLEFQCIRKPGSRRGPEEWRAPAPVSRLELSRSELRCAAEIQRRTWDHASLLFADEPAETRDVF